MSGRKNKWLKRAILVVAVAIVASSAALMVSGSSHVTTEQTADNTTVQAGETVNFTVTLDTPSEFNGPAVDVDLPENWSVVDQSSSPPGTYRSSEIQWIWLSGGEKTVDYTVEIPENASDGTYQVVANGSAINGTTSESVADENVTEITVDTARTNQPPTANFTIDPSEPTVGENVVLLGAASSDPDGSITSYAWDLDDDGNFDDGSAIEEAVTFDSPGEKNVSLRVTDDDGATDTVRKTITVGSSAPPAAVTFTNQTTDGTTITVDSVRMDDGGFVTMHNGSLFEGDPIGSVVGVSEYLAPGTYENVTISLDEPLEETQTLVAMPHRDTNDNQTYDFVETGGSEDAPYMADGSAVTDDAVVTIVAPAFEVSNLDAPASAVTGDTITVNATISNVGGAAGTTDAEFVFAGSALLNETVSLGAGNATDVSFDVPTDGVAPGTYEHGVRAGDSFLTANITIQQPATFEVSNLDAPASAVQGETITVNATIANVGDVQGSTTAEFVFAGDVLLNQSVTLGAGNATDVSFDVPTDGVAPGTYEHGVRAGDSLRTANITIQQPATFEVSNLDAPASAVTGDTITVNATVSNVGGVAGTTDAEFVFAGSALLNETVSLGAGNSTDVSFDVPTDGVAPGTYEHGVRAGDSFLTANITIQQPATFEVSNLQAPASAQQGASINVSAVVTNVGDVRGSITAAFEFNGTVLLNETITLDPGNATNVSFQVSTTDIATGNYTHRVVAGSSSESARITISAANETDTPQRISPGQPGFGVGVAVAALLALLVLARRRS